MNRETTLEYLGRVHTTIAKGYAIGPTTRRPDYAFVPGDDLPDDWASLRRRKLISTRKMEQGWAVQLTSEGRRYWNKFKQWSPM